MRSRRGFTLMEILIVIVLVSSLAIGLVAVINPLEQIRRAQDAAMFLLMKDVHGSIARVMMQQGGSLWNEELSAESLASPSGRLVMEALLKANEFKRDTYDENATKFGFLLLSAPRDGTMYSLCYKPIAQAFITSKDNRYNDRGGFEDGCPGNSCYTCLFAGNSMSEAPTRIPLPTATPAPTAMPLPTATPVPTAAPGCDPFDPEYPIYGFTCNYSSKWAKYSCTNYCVHDWGCGGGKCKADERRLEKMYFAGGGQAFIDCLSHDSETSEEYCIGGREANCNHINYPSSDLDYHWGCTNPRRPYEWVEY